MHDIDVNGLLLWGLLFWVLNRQPQVRLVTQRFTLRGLFSRPPRTDP